MCLLGSISFFFKNSTPYSQVENINLHLIFLIEFFLNSKLEMNLVELEFNLKIEFPSIQVAYNIVQYFHLDEAFQKTIY